MKAAVLKSPGKYEIAEVPIPQVSAGEVLVRVKATGICGSDKFLTKILPEGSIQGHEVSGIVVDGEGIEKDTKVWINPFIRCGKCYYCKRGEFQYCDSLYTLGCGPNDLHSMGCAPKPGEGWPGAFAEYVKVPLENVVELPPQLGFDEAAAAEPLGTPMRAINRSWDPSMKSVLLLGLGTVGFYALQLFVIRGVERIIVTDLSDAHLKLGEKLGATDIINAGTENVIERVKDITAGHGVDIVMNLVAANKEVINESFQMVRKGGKVLFVTEIDHPVLIDYSAIMIKELTIIGTEGGVPWWGNCLKLIARKIIDARSLITHRFRLENFQQAFNVAHELESIKVVVNS